MSKLVGRENKNPIFTYFFLERKYSIHASKSETPLHVIFGTLKLFRFNNADGPKGNIIWTQKQFCRNIYFDIDIFI